MPRLTTADIAELLGERGHLLRVATVDDDGFPRVVPIWFIRQGPRVGLSIDEDPLPYRKVTTRGTARIIHEPGNDDEWRDLYRSIAKRYVDDDVADAYVDNTSDQPRALIAVSMMAPDSVTTTWRMPVGDEDATGIWHRRYFLDGTLMANLADGRLST